MERIERYLAVLILFVSIVYICESQAHPAGHPAITEVLRQTTPEGILHTGYVDASGPKKRATLGISKATGGLGHQYTVDNTLATPIWFFVVFEPVYPLGNYPTVKGTVPIQQDQTGKLYANIYVKATSSVVAFSSATDLGTFAFAYRLAFQSECDSFGGALSSSASTQFCYRMECPEDSYCTFDVSTDLYSPLSVRAFQNNAAIADETGVNWANTLIDKPLLGRQPPNGPVRWERVATIRQVAGGANSWAFGFNYYIRIGALHAEHDRNAVYWYPWNGTFLIGQGNGGSFSHQVNTADQYAIDVMMDEGTPIYAARAGYVSLVVNTNRYSKFDTTVCPGGPATCTAALTNQNHVVITHDDMTQAWYIHLMENGATVVEGEYVAPGQLLGYSGNTGYSTAPHLHFGLRVPVNLVSGAQKSIQVFYTTDGWGWPQNIPKQGDYVEGTAGVLILPPMRVEPMFPPEWYLPVAPPPIYVRPPPPVLSPVLQPIDPIPVTPPLGLQTEPPFELVGIPPVTIDRHSLVINIRTVYPLSHSQISSLAAALPLVASTFAMEPLEAVYVTVAANWMSSVEYAVTISFSTDTTFLAFHRLLQDASNRAVLEQAIIEGGNAVLSGSAVKIVSASMDMAAISAAVRSYSASFALLGAILIVFLFRKNVF